MSYSHLTTDRRHLNHIIQERLNRRFQNNADLLGTLGGRGIFADIQTPAALQPTERVVAENVYFSSPYQLPPEDNQPRVLIAEQIRQSIPVSMPAPLAAPQTAPLQEYIQAPIVSQISSLQTSTPIHLIRQQEQPTFVQERRIPVPVPVPVQSSVPVTTNINVNADLVRETTTIVREYPSPRVSGKQELLTQEPLSRVINVTTTESIDPIPAPVVIRRSEPRIVAVRDATVADQDALVEQNRRLQGMLVRAQVERDAAESSIQELRDYLNPPNGDLMAALRDLNTRLSFSEGRQIALSDEKKALELELGAVRQELKKMAEALETQEVFKNKEIERLTGKGAALQELAERLAESLSSRRPSEEVVATAVVSDSAPDNGQLQAKIDELQAKLIEAEHAYFVKENDLLQKNASLELHFEKQKEELAAARLHVQMAHLRSSLDQPKTRPEDLAEAEAKFAAELDRLKAMLRTTTADLEKSKNEANALAASLRARTEEAQESEVHLFEACLRVAFLSAELERLRARLPAKA